MAGVWLGRVQIAETAANGWCATQDLDCEFDVDRLDFGGLTLRNIRISGASAEPAIVADRFSLDLDWAGPFVARPAWVGGGDLVVRLNATGQGPLLGDLDKAVSSLTSGQKSGAGVKMPRLDFQEVRVVAATLLGPVEASGYIRSTGTDTFDIRIAAPRTMLNGPLGTLEFAGGELVATRKGADLDGRLTLDLPRFDSPMAKASMVKVDLDLNQASNVFSANGHITAESLGSGDSALSGVDVALSLQSGALDLAAIRPASLYDSLQALTANVSIDSGQAEAGRFGASNLTLNLSPAGEHVSGEANITVTNAAFGETSADQLAASALVSLPPTLGEALVGNFTATGIARVSGASLAPDLSDEMIKTATSPLAILPSFADAATRALGRAGQDFNAEAGWMLNRTGEGVDLSIPEAAMLTSASGLKAAFAGDEAPLFVWTTRAPTAWAAAGTVALSGGGGPDATIDITRATGGDAISIEGSANVSSWRTGSESLTASLADLRFTMGGEAGEGGRLSTALDARLNGELFGLDWKDLKTGIPLEVSWSPDTLSISTPQSVPLAWESATLDKTRFGAGSASFTPAGAIAAREGERPLAGSGSISRLSLPVEGDGFTARVALGPARVNWSAADTTSVDIRTGPIAAELLQGDMITPVTFPDATARLRLKDGWTLDADFADGEARLDAASARDIKGKLMLSGVEGREMSGRVSDFSLLVVDPTAETSGRKFEPMRVTGQAILNEGEADFSGLITLAANDLQVGSVTGEHSLKGANGQLTFTGAPLLFRPDGFQPYALSPLLRGPANVTGRVDLSGSASWTKDALNASAGAALDGIGFALAGAGVFEGVSGRIEVSDLLKGVSPPGQEISIDTVTLGIPFEDGRLRFQLLGYDAVRLEDASWPFAGGRLNIRPVDYAIGGTGETRFVGEAVNWDLAAMVEQFKVPDLKAEGTVSGEFPIVFSTGSARIDHAVLAASEEGGVIRYGGSTGDAAASADASAKMLFDALKDFRYRVMRVELDGDLAGRMVLKLDLLGSNPEVFYGSAFDIGISIDSPLLNLLNIVNQGQDEVNAIVERVTGGQAPGQAPGQATGSPQ
jgi:translocation and assembly module TamB